ncbi:MAG: hypothetical protein Q7R49_02490 [Candidatus Daviesbacteria bacterium]|nr:hypothetical protein [Candidatus Daviesbacteria bacterium]
MIKLHFVPKSSRDKERIYEIAEGAPLRESKLYWSFLDKDGYRQILKKAAFDLVK